MPPKIGYLLPTRERVMEGRPQTGPLLDLAARAEGLGFDSVWVGDAISDRDRGSLFDRGTRTACVVGARVRMFLGRERMHQNPRQRPATCTANRH